LPQLDWDETDFMICLEAVPEVKEYGVQHLYRVEKHGIALVVIVRQLESLVWLSLRQVDSVAPLIEFDLYVRGGVKYVNDKRGEYLELSDCLLTPTRCTSFWSEGEFEKRLGTGHHVRLTVKPGVQIAFVDV
jgi:hypothetical protein